jgi:septal ring factor EnvC (AmiA/AmiB activator)
MSVKNEEEMPNQLRKKQVGTVDFLEFLEKEFGSIKRQLNKINRRLDQIMATQEEFDAQIAAANASLDSISTDLTNISAAITAEAQQISDFIASLPAGTDTSALDGVVTRLGTTADSLSGTADAVGGIFTPPAA